MAVSLRGAGTVNASGTAVGSIATTVSSSATAADVTILGVTMKPYTATIADTITGFSKVLEITSGTTANGADVGSTKTAYYVGFGVAASTVVAVGGAISGGDTATCGCVTYQKQSTFGWDVGVTTTGIDNTHGANFSATADSGLNVASGDVLVGIGGLNSDNGSISGPSFGTLTGATLSAVTTQQSAPTNTSNDCHVRIWDVSITAGSSNVAPVLTYTNASSSAGAVIFIRVRETANVAAAVGIGVGAAGEDTIGLTAAAAIGVATTGVTTGVGLTAAPTIGVATVPVIGNIGLTAAQAIGIGLSILVTAGSSLEFLNTYEDLIDADYTGSLSDMRRANLLDLLSLDSSSLSNNDLEFLYRRTVLAQTGSIMDMRSQDA